MADSIHDQWPTATSEWPNVAAQFEAAWIGVEAAYDLNPQYAAFAAAIGYLARMMQDSTVMAGDMITDIASTGGNSTAGLVRNLQNLQQTVLPQWGFLAAQYVNTQVFTAVNKEQSDREAADAVLAQLIATVNNQTRQLDTTMVNQEALQRVLGDQAVLAQAVRLIGQEAAARAAGDDASRQQAEAGDKAVYDAVLGQLQPILAYAQSIPGLIDTRAANGYDPTLRSRASLIGRLLDTVAAHEPGIAQLVSKLATALVDLAGVEDPLVRVAAQLILKQVIDRLGVDTALHAMLGDIVGAILGGGPPKTLTDIMADIGNRLDALEGSAAALAPLAPEADNLHELGTVIFDAALLAFLAAAVADPVAAADDTNVALAAVTGPLLAPVRSLLGMP